MKRYRAVTRDLTGHFLAEIEEDPAGDLVDYDDALQGRPK